jgi:hypothetical protein
LDDLGDPDLDGGKSDGDHLRGDSLALHGAFCPHQLQHLFLSFIDARPEIDDHPSVQHVVLVDHGQIVTGRMQAGEAHSSHRREGKDEYHEDQDESRRDPHGASPGSPTGSAWGRHVRHHLGYRFHAR